MIFYLLPFDDSPLDKLLANSFRALRFFWEIAGFFLQLASQFSSKHAKQSTAKPLPALLKQLPLDFFGTWGLKVPYSSDFPVRLQPWCTSKLSAGGNTVFLANLFNRLMTDFMFSTYFSSNSLFCRSSIMARVFLRLFFPFVTTLHFLSIINVK